MKTLQLVLGLLAGIGAVCSLGALALTSSTAGIAVHAVCAIGSGFTAARLVMGALFGTGGLVVDLGRVSDMRFAREERERPPAVRGPRSTNPSRALRERGAEPRLRVAGERRYRRHARLRAA